jgi:SNF family Na+-dependent transporter
VIHFAPGVDSVDVLVATLLDQEAEKHFSLSFDNLPAAMGNVKRAIGLVHFFPFLFPTLTTSLSVFSFSGAFPLRWQL